MIFKIVIKKMLTQYNNPINYYINLFKQNISLNNLINKKIKISHLGYQCLYCKKNKKIQAMGYCFNCFSIIPQTGKYIFHPEKSTAHLGIEDRNLEYETKFQLQPHIVYLANSGTIKVGVTKVNQMLTRWIDQGAEQVIIFAKTTNRYEAGIIEKQLKKYISDKTSWKKMLSSKTSVPISNLYTIKQKLKYKINNKLTLDFFVKKNNIFKIQYPILYYPNNFISINLNKCKEIYGTIIGIKGQYLIFKNQVFNWRSHEGYIIQLEVLN